MPVEPKTQRVTVTQALRLDLMEAIAAVREGTIQPETAIAIATLSSQVLASAKLDLEVMKFKANAGQPLPLAAPNGNGHKLIDIGSHGELEALK